ncbi:MAG TPA: chromophore lyase CpcT/CpeT [Leptolyngbyaceae cyanobacterium]
MAATLSPRLLTLAQALAGEFDNREQSLADPAWYVHLKVWHRPVALFSEDSATFFIEQVSVASNQPPYRQRILRLQDQGVGLSGQYYGLKEPLKFRGGAIAPELLASLNEADLVELPTCRLLIEAQAQPNQQHRFQAAPPPDTLCSFEADGTLRYVKLGFEIGPTNPINDPRLELRVYDKGIDPSTGKGLWGALMGPFCLHKVADFKNF